MTKIRVIHTLYSHPSISNITQGISDMIVDVEKIKDSVSISPKRRRQ